MFGWEWNGKEWMFDDTINIFIFAMRVCFLSRGEGCGGKMCGNLHELVI